MSAPAPRKTGLTSFWASAAVGCSVLVTAADATILEATRGGFSNGFGSVLLDTLGLRARYAATAMLVNGFVILACWTVLAPLFARITVRPGRVLTLCVFSVLCAAAWADVLMYEIHATIGALVTPGVVMELAGGRVDSFNEASAIATAVLGTGAAASLIGLFLAVRLGDRVLYAVDPARLAPPRGRMLLGGTAALALAGTAALSSTSESAAEVREALHLQTAANLLTQAVNTATDVDFDGTGWLSRPTDAAPFDAAIHPFAIDLPANGIDEDQLAGDLPATATAPRSTPVPDPASAAGRRPHVLIVYLESFRFDLLATQVDGRAVTPFLSALATEGASSSHTYVHSPYTTRSRGQLFGGTLVPTPGQQTWIDDFATRGYRTAHFSGQDDSFGDSEALLGTERADRFYDARDDKARRTSRSTAASSLQVSWKLLLQRVQTFLTEVRRDEPLFLYVNIVDTHYPYHHDGLDSILYDQPVDRSGIRSANRDAVWATYLNAAANVDRAVEQLVGSFREAIGGSSHVILVTSDHGQSFYEEGALGHGRRLDRRQTQVPLIVYGTGGVWPEPLGASDVRGLLLASLEAPPAQRPRFAPEPDRRVFQYLPTLERPSRLALRGIDGSVIYDMRRGIATRNTGDEIEPGDPEWRRLIHAWEALRLAP